MPSSTKSASSLNRRQRSRRLQARLDEPGAPPLAGPADGLLLATALALSGLGLLAILTSSAHTAEVIAHNGLYFFWRQLFWFIVSLAALIYVQARPIDRWRPYLHSALIACAILLFATYLPGIGHTRNGATRWIHLGLFTFQPSELAKVALVLYAADYLGKSWQYPWPAAQRLTALLPIGGILGLIMFQPDLGTTIAAALCVGAVFVAAGTPWPKLGAWVGAGAVGILLMSWHTPYQRARLLAYLDPWADARGIGYHLVQSLMAIGSGGVWGVGLGQGQQKLFYLPEQHTDFIYAVIGEELGIAGTVGILLLFLLLAQRGLRIAYRVEDPFLKLVVVGLTALICGQALLNISVVTASIPTTGIPLPMISYGGTSLLVNLIAIGLMLSASRAVPPPASDREPSEGGIQGAGHLPPGARA